MNSSNVPRLLYVGNVPVESSYHGSALIYRLLQSYAPDRLMIIEDEANRSLPNRRLLDVKYESIHAGFRRLLYSRFSLAYSSLLMFLAAFWRRSIIKKLGHFKPEAILTVAHGPLWITAHALSQQLGIPLHLICHDEITMTTPHIHWLRPHLENVFLKCYNQAKNRYVVSPYMRDDYEQRFGCGALVLYPSRASDAPKFYDPPERLGLPVNGLTVAFAGTINTGGHIELLKLQAEALADQGGRLLLFGPLSIDDAVRVGLALKNVECRGLLSSAELIKSFRDEVDLLLVPMSFEDGASLAMQTNFPSKLTDYTIAGLPILIHGPDNCSAVRWALDNPGVALIATEPSKGALIPLLSLMLHQSSARIRFGQRALDIGNEFFDSTKGQQMLLNGLMHSQS